MEITGCMFVKSHMLIEPTAGCGGYGFSSIVKGSDGIVFR